VSSSHIQSIIGLYDAKRKFAKDLQSIYIVSMSPFFVLPNIKQKLWEKHQVNVEEAKEAFYGVDESDFVEELREEHKRDNKRLWFIGETFLGRRLKVVFEEVGEVLELITAYDPSEEDEIGYEKYKERK
jgi:uncharacterized DUF497 family protein